MIRADRGWRVGEDLTSRFRSTRENSTGGFAIPLVVSLPKGAYMTVTFVENGKEVVKARLRHRAESPWTGTRGKAP